MVKISDKFFCKKFLGLGCCDKTASENDFSSRYPIHPGFGSRLSSHKEAKLGELGWISVNNFQCSKMERNAKNMGTGREQNIFNITKKTSLAIDYL